MDKQRGDEQSTPEQRRVLVVDDNADLVTSLAMLLNSWGYDVGTALDGYAAIAMCKSFRPQVAICDVRMPGMDGFELARAIRNLDGSETICLIAMTASDEEEYQDEARQAGFSVFQKKPIDAEKLRSFLDTIW